MDPHPKTVLRRSKFAMVILKNTPSPLLPLHAAPTSQSEANAQTPVGWEGTLWEFLGRLRGRRNKSSQKSQEFQLAYALMKLSQGNSATSQPSLWRRVLGRIAWSLRKMSDLLVRSGASLPPAPHDPCWPSMSPRAARKLASQKAPCSSHPASLLIPASFSGDTPSHPA